MVTKFEYRTLDLNPISAKVAAVDLLNAAGQDGWRLIHIALNNIAYLEREIPEEPLAEPAKKARVTKPRA